MDIIRKESSKRNDSKPWHEYQTWKLLGVNWATPERSLLTIVAGLDSLDGLQNYGMLLIGNDFMIPGPSLPYWCRDQGSPEIKFKATNPGSLSVPSKLQVLFNLHPHTPALHTYLLSQTLCPHLLALQSALCFHELVTLPILIPTVLLYLSVSHSSTLPRWHCAKLNGANRRRLGRKVSCWPVYMALFPFSGTVLQWLSWESCSGVSG
jgi:hypothetical protein